MHCLPHLSHDFFQRARSIEALISDVDGVLTDGKIIYSDDRMIKQFSALDGAGIKLAQAAGLTTGLISAGKSSAVRQRAAILNIPHLYLGRWDKEAALEELLEVLKLPATAICYIGDDLPDIPVLKRVGLPVAVANAMPAVKEAAGLQTTRQGGDGALREVVEFVLYAQGRLTAALQEFELRNSGEQPQN